MLKADDVFLEERASEHEVFAFVLRVHRANLYCVCVLSQCWDTQFELCSLSHSSLLSEAIPVHWRGAVCLWYPTTGLLIFFCIVKL